eukprot:scaffold6552_cov61-Phaeocystis_antarctica.AAC.8
MPCAASRLSAATSLLAGTAPRSTAKGPKFAHLLVFSRSAEHDRCSSPGSRARLSFSGAAGAASALFMAHQPRERMRIASRVTANCACCGQTSDARDSSAPPAPAPPAAVSRRSNAWLSTNVRSHQLARRETGLCACKALAVPLPAAARVNLGGHPLHLHPARARLQRPELASLARAVGHLGTRAAQSRQVATAHRLEPLGGAHARTAQHGAVGVVLQEDHHGRQDGVSLARGAVRAVHAVQAPRLPPARQLRRQAAAAGALCVDERTDRWLLRVLACERGKAVELHALVAARRCPARRGPRDDKREARRGDGDEANCTAGCCGSSSTACRFLRNRSRRRTRTQKSHTDRDIDSEGVPATARQDGA